MKQNLLFEISFFIKQTASASPIAIVNVVEDVGAVSRGQASFSTLMFIKTSAYLARVEFSFLPLQLVVY